MPLSLADYLAYVRSRALPGYAPPASVAADPDFGTRSSVVSDPAGTSNTGTAALAGRGDTSLGGRLALNADMNVSNVSMAKNALGLVGLFAGPLGGIASKAAALGVNMHNQSEISQALSKAGFKIGESPPELVAEAINQAMQAQPQNPQITMGLPGTPGHPAFGHLGFNAPSQTPNPTNNLNIFGQRADENAPPPDETAPPSTIDVNEGQTAGSATGNAGTGAGVAGGAAPGGSSGGTSTSGSGDAYHEGGVVQDREPGLEERITALEQEYVVRADRSKKYRPLLEAINKGSEPAIKRALKAALTA